MKRIISLLLAISISFSCITIGFAQEPEACSCGVTPVIYIPGFGEAIYMNPESEERVSIFPPESNVIVDCIPQFIKAVVALLITHNHKNFGDAAIDVLNAMFGPASCNFDGTPMYENTGIKPKALPDNSEQHKIANYEFRGSSDEPTGEYTFYYDSRLDPFYNAELLKEFVDHIKELTGHQTVSFAAHSQGSSVLATYLYIYGTKNIDKLLFLSPAFRGLSIMGGLFSHELSLENKSEEFRLFLSQLLGNGTAGKMLNPLILLLIKTGAVDSLLTIAETALFDQLDRITENSLAPTIGSMPGLWTFVPIEYYETAKEKVFGNDSRYEPLIEKIDNYHYNVSIKLPEILSEAKSNGCSVIISVGYGAGSAPITVRQPMQSDALIETEYASIGATCADFPSTLANDYVQANSDCGHNHLSPERIIDASTCAFPENTWFFKNQDHNGYDGEILEFLNWAMLYSGQPTITVNSEYPQFMQYSPETYEISTDIF